MDVVKQIAQVATDINDRPKMPVKVFDCGELDLATGLVKRKQSESIFNQDRAIEFDYQTFTKTNQDDEDDEGSKYLSIVQRYEQKPRIRK